MMVKAEQDRVDFTQPALLHPLDRHFVRKLQLDGLPNYGTFWAEMSLVDRGAAGAGATPMSTPLSSGCSRMAIAGITTSPRSCSPRGRHPEDEGDPGYRLRPARFVHRRAAGLYSVTRAYAPARPPSDLADDRCGRRAPQRCTASLRYCCVSAFRIYAARIAHSRGTLTPRRRDPPDASLSAAELGPRLRLSTAMHVSAADGVLAMPLPVALLLVIAGASCQLRRRRRAAVALTSRVAASSVSHPSASLPTC